MPLVVESPLQSQPCTEPNEAARAKRLQAEYGVRFLKRNGRWVRITGNWPLLFLQVGLEFD
jgi:hypothetical protein